MRVLRICTYKDEYPPFLFELKGSISSFSVDIRSIYLGYLYYLVTEVNFQDTWEEYLYFTLCDIRDITDSKITIDKDKMDKYIKQIERICNLMYLRYQENYLVVE